MQPIAFPALLGAALLAACSTPVTPPADASQGWRTYLCDSGQRIQTRHPDTDSVALQFDAKPARVLQLAVSASGARYVGQGLEWWTKGSGPGAAASLFRHEADGSSGALLDRCAEQAFRP